MGNQEISFDIEDLEYTQYFYEDALSDVVPLMLVKILQITKVVNMLWK